MLLMFQIRLSSSILWLRLYWFNLLSCCNSIVLWMALQESGLMELHPGLLKLSLVNCCGNRMNRQLLIIYRLLGLVMSMILPILPYFSPIMTRVNILEEKLLLLLGKLYLGFDHHIQYLFIIYICFRNKNQKLFIFY
jgi:hypothetical protein